MKTPLLHPFRAFACLALLPLLAAAQPRPVPLMQAVPLPHHQISFQRDGAELCRYHFAPTQERPFLHPLNGPSGRSHTRMGHPHDAESHSHHNSVWLSHHSVNGTSFWEDRGKGRVVHLRVEKLEDGADEAAVTVWNTWQASGTNVLHERRRIAARPLPRGEWLLLLDARFEPAGTNAVPLGQTPFGLLGVRMAKTIGVNDGGGRILNSAGGVDEAGTFRRPARWLDYSGPVTTTASGGITLMDHPGNPGHPVPFHTRNDGWMGASLTASNALVITSNSPLVLRYGLLVHESVPTAEAIEPRYEDFTRMVKPDLSVRMK